MKLACVFGTRPEIIKLASIIKETEKSGDELLLIHTGQHYDYEMSDTFIKTLDLPAPDYNLGVGSADRLAQIAATMERLEGVLADESPDILLVQGDTNVVPAALLVARHMLTPSGHVEAGLRSFNQRSPEEINRKTASSLAMVHFAPTELNRFFLSLEGVPMEKVFVTGSTVVDAVNMVRGRIEDCGVLERLGIKTGPLLLVTAHRPSNVDDEKTLARIIGALTELKEFTTVFPIHPRTRKNAEKFGLMDQLEEAEHMILTPPLDYVDFLALMKASDLVLTDSGGVQEEACCFRKPVVTMRNTTPRWETVLLGMNFLVGTDKGRIVSTVRRVFRESKRGGAPRKMPNPYGDGRSGARIVHIIKKMHARKKLEYGEPKLGVPASVRKAWGKILGK